jgi:hypothetical protein
VGYLKANPPRSRDEFAGVASRSASAALGFSEIELQEPAKKGAKER